MSTHFNGDAFSLVKYPPQNTPVLDESYSPISNIGEVTPFTTTDLHDIMGEPQAVNSAFEPTPLPNGKRPTKRRGTYSTERGTDPDTKLSEAISNMEARLSSEIAGLRTEIKTMEKSVQNLADVIEGRDDNSRTYAEHIQSTFTSGVNHLVSLLGKQKKKIHQASSLLTELLADDN